VHSNTSSLHLLCKTTDLLSSMPARAGSGGNGNCQWTRDDEATIVRVVKEHKEKGSWGDNNPKKTAFTACEIALAGSEAKSGGGPKTFKAIKNRWQRVCIIVLIIVCAVKAFLQLKKEYLIVKQLRSMSGWSWHAITNLPNVEHPVWEAYVSVSPPLFSVPVQRVNPCRNIRAPSLFAPRNSLCLMTWRNL
jgi:hypothetical protein